VRFAGLFGPFAHVAMGLFGSASMTVTSDTRASCDDNTNAEVVLPAPPFGLTKTIVGIIFSLRLRIANSYLVAIWYQLSSKSIKKASYLVATR